MLQSFATLFTMWNKLNEMESYKFWTLFMLSWISLINSEGTSKGDVQDYCQLETFEAKCGPDEVIVVGSANYGRMGLGRCVKINYGSLGCASDVLAEMDRKCSGRHECQFVVSELHGTQPCPGDLTPYLEASYECVKVITTSESPCLTRQHSLLKETTGTIANIITEDTQHGSESCPWLIQAQPGQVINITLINFARAPHVAVVENEDGEPDIGLPDLGGSKPRPRICYQFANIKEGGRVKSITECEGSPRTVHAYQSETENVQISIHTRKNSQEYFLLKYAVIGCVNPTAPKGGYVKRTGETVMIKCNDTDETWYMTCTGNSWKGIMGNCTPSSTTWSAGQIFSNSGSFPYGLLIVVAIGVALGIFLGGILLTLASIYMKRKQRNRPDVEQDMEHIDHYSDGTMVRFGTTQRIPCNFKELPPDMEPALMHTHTKECSLANAPEYQQYGYHEGTVGTMCHAAYPTQTGTTRPPGHIYESPKFGRRN